MRCELLAVLLSVFPLQSAQPAAVPDQARQVVDKAIQAMGGLEKLAAAQGSIRKVKGSFPGETFLGETWLQTPDLLKMESIWFPGMGHKVDRFLLLKGGKGWLRVDGQLIALEAAEMAQFNRARHADKVAGLVALVQSKGFTLSTVGETKVKNQAALEIKVQYPGQPDMHLFFDKADGFLVKTWQKFEDANVSKKFVFVIHEGYYSQYKQIDPVGKEKKLLQDAKLGTKAQPLLQWLAGRSLSTAKKAEIAQLIRDLGSPSFPVRTKALIKLKKIGPEARAHLEKAMSTADAEVTERVKECLAHYAEDPAVALIPAALRLIALQRPASAAEVILDYLPSAPGPLIRTEVEAALFDLAQGGKVDPGLLKALVDPDLAKRTVAAAALGHDGGAYAKKPGRRMLIDGLKLSTRCDLHRNGNADLQLDILDVQFFNALDESLFKLPN